MDNQGFGFLVFFIYFIFLVVMCVCICKVANSKKDHPIPLIRDTSNENQANRVDFTETRSQTSRPASTSVNITNIGFSSSSQPYPSVPHSSRYPVNMPQPSLQYPPSNSSLPYPITQSSMPYPAYQSSVPYSAHQSSAPYPTFQPSAPYHTSQFSPKTSLKPDSNDLPPSFEEAMGLVHKNN